MSTYYLLREKSCETTAVLQKLHWPTLTTAQKQGLKSLRPIRTEEIVNFNADMTGMDFLM